MMSLLPELENLLIRISTNMPARRAFKNFAGLSVLRASAFIPIFPPRTAESFRARTLLLSAGRFLLRLLEFFQLFNQGAHLPAILALICRHLRRGFRHDKRVRNPILRQQEIDISEYGFR